MKGVAIHFPLSCDETNSFIQNTLPNYEALDILVSNLLTKANKIWRALVNLENLYNAISWLKNNIIHFKDIQVLPKDYIPSYHTIHFKDNSKTAESSSEPFLEQNTG